MGEKEKKNDVIKKQKRETKSKGFYMRMSPSELEALDFLSYACDESKTEIMRKAFKMYHDINKNKL